jgi:NO-binding membrane sensor protein with MHYT domain
MPHQTLVDLATHQMLVLVAGSVCLFGTWVGMRHFACARATEGSTRHGWLFMASVGTGAALWASTFISILALDPSLNSGFDLVPTAGTLIIAIISCLVGFEIGSKPKPALAPEIGGLVMGTGILAMHYLGLKAWHINGITQWNGNGVAVTFVLGLGLGTLSVNRANRPVTRWCRHGAAITLAVMICAMHYALTASATAIPDTSVVLSADLIPAKMLGVGVVGAVLLVMGSGFSSYTIDLRARTESAKRIHQLSFNDAMTGLSLATLHAFPFDKLKLDQSFVKRLPGDAAAAAIVRTVLGLGESLGMPVLAEGIETRAQ